MEILNKPLKKLFHTTVQIIEFNKLNYRSCVEIKIFTIIMMLRKLNT